MHKSTGEPLGSSKLEATFLPSFQPLQTYLSGRKRESEGEGWERTAPHVLFISPKSCGY